VAHKPRLRTPQDQIFKLSLAFTPESVLIIMAWMVNMLRFTSAILGMTLSAHSAWAQHKPIGPAPDPERPWIVVVVSVVLVVLVLIASFKTSKRGHRD